MLPVKSTAQGVLCVDDNAQVLHALKTALTKFGYAVETVGSGWDAMRRLRSATGRFHVIVTDIRMPGLTGVQLIRQSRALGYHGPFVVCAAGIADADRSSVLALGVKHVIDKTAGVADLVAAVQEAAASYVPPEPVTPPARSAMKVDDESPEDGLAEEDSADDESLEDEDGQRYHGPAGKRRPPR